MTQDIVRHFTATGFVVHNGHVALHWHSKVKAWLPPGGHIEDNEDPVQAVVREIREESGLEAVVVQTSPVIELDYPQQVLPPYTIEVEDIDDPVHGYHQHIDMIYFCRGPKTLNLLKEGWFLVNQHQLTNNESLVNNLGQLAPIPDDVRLLGLQAINMAMKPTNHETAP